jgi:E3 ubiquitin-protein ligase UBR4
MRLSGVAQSCPTLASRISAGGSALVIQEFSAQMHAVCKIALHRQSDLAKFIDQHGKCAFPWT